MAQTISRRSPMSTPRARLLAALLTLAALLFAAASASASTQFDNTADIDIPSGQATASPYPSTIDVSGVPTSGYTVQVALHGLSHSLWRGVHVLLQAPDGSATALMQLPDNLGSTRDGGRDFTFAKGDYPLLPSSGTVSSGTYRPTETGNFKEFPAPAPASPGGSHVYGSDLSAVSAGDPNGTWKLYVQNAVVGEFGHITGGWSLILTPDTTDPTVSIAQPTQNEHFAQNEAATFSFSCDDDGAIASCVGDYDGTSGIKSGDPIPTGSPGLNIFGVTATDRAGHSHRTGVWYTVDADHTDPTITVDTP